MAAGRAGQVGATTTFDSDHDLRNLQPSENPSDDLDAKVPLSSRNSETTGLPASDGDSPNVAAHPGLNVQAKPSFVTPPSMNPQASVPRGGNRDSFSVDSTGQNNGDGTDVGPHGISVSDNDRPAALRRESIDAAAPLGRPVPGELEHRTVDVIVDASGIWHRDRVKASTLVR
jgi:hypothetical protein